MRPKAPGRYWFSNCEKAKPSPALDVFTQSESDETPTAKTPAPLPSSSTTAHLRWITRSSVTPELKRQEGGNRSPHKRTQEPRQSSPHFFIEFVDLHPHATFRPFLEPRSKQSRLRESGIIKITSIFPLQRMTDSAGPSNEKRKANSAGDDVVDLEYSANFNFRDGNVFLIALDTAFRVHMTLLERHSEVFRDLFSQASQPIHGSNLTDVQPYIRQMEYQS
ncbi:hypothetical protein M422DRAFT_244884 [Sphaerobolus stellatus SS14]|nr:hypothetical protein M422DRAFT_244884 [Sphaerobolus stellatus SS14]